MTDQRVCEHCGTPLPVPEVKGRGRPRKFCPDKPCKRQFHEKLTRDLARRAREIGEVAR